MKSVYSLLTLLLVTPLIAAAGIPPLDLSYAESAYSGGEPIALRVLPDGTGAPLTQARVFSGSGADATITIHVRDYNDDPVALYPREDMWLESADEGLVMCPAGTIADANTDSEGISTWTAPLRAGGWSQAGCRVYLNGAPLLGPAIPLQFNSPDLNGDLASDLIDVTLFVRDFYGPYQFRSDILYDGRVDLLDLVLMVQAMGADCP